MLILSFLPPKMIYSFFRHLLFVSYLQVSMSENVNMDAVIEIAEHFAQLHDFAKELADIYKKGSSTSQGVVSLPLTTSFASSSC